MIDLKAQFCPSVEIGPQLHDEVITDAENVIESFISSYKKSSAATRWMKC